MSIVTSRKCTIPLSKFRAPPFDKPLDNLIVGKIAAINSVGQGAESPLNTAGAKIQTEPANPPSGPAVVIYDEASATISLGVLTGLQAGNSAILYYELSWDQGSS